MKKKLSEKQANVLQAIREYQQDYGYSPTVRELAGQLGYSSPAGIHKILTLLNQEGYVVKPDRKSRSIGFLEHDGEENTVKAPIVGNVAAGEPQLAYEENEGDFFLDRHWLKAEKPFLLRVQGFSMIDADIKPGDLLVIEPASTCQNGEIIIALLDDEATVKRFYKERDQIRLQPENTAMQPIYVQRDDPGFRIIGRVKGLLRKFDNA